MTILNRQIPATWAALACLNLVCSEAAPAQQGSEAAVGDGHPALEEIVVTASKREERLVDVPESVSVLSAKTIENLNVQSFQDYASLVPNLNQAGGLGIGSGTIILRGLNTGPQSLTNTTSVYLGETPLDRKSVV